MYLDESSLSLSVLFASHNMIGWLMHSWTVEIACNSMINYFLL